MAKEPKPRKPRAKKAPKVVKVEVATDKETINEWETRRRRARREQLRKGGENE